MNRYKNPGAFDAKVHGTEKNFYRMNTKAYVDCDYESRLSAKDREWLSRFLIEYYGASFSKENPIHDLEGRRKCMKAAYDRRYEIVNASLDFLERKSK